MSFLVLIGVMIGYICSAVTDFLVTFAEDSDIVNLHNWSMGSFSGITWENVKTIVFVVAVTGILTFFLSKPMEAYQLGEDRGAADGKAVIPDGKTDHHDTGMFFRWGSILHVL